MTLNKRITNRQQVFYWQTDRDITQEELIDIWQNRHSPFEESNIKEDLNTFLLKNNYSFQIESVEVRDENSQLVLGNVNSSFEATLTSGESVILRLHPVNIENGYFNVEALCANKSIKAGLPSYKTFAIGYITNGSPFAFQIIQKLPGLTTQKYLEKNPEDEEKVLFCVGETLAKIHNIKTEGFGPFNNEKAKEGNLIGLHDSFVDYLFASLEANLTVLKNKNIINDAQIQKINNIFSNFDYSNTQSVLVHNDFADWNQLTNGSEITGIIDWDEAISSDPIMDIACWSTFFQPSRLELMLNGYFNQSKTVSNNDEFNEKIKLFRLRYMISKMTLRLRKSEWNNDESLLLLIKNGTANLNELFKYFKI